MLVLTPAPKHHNPHMIQVYDKVKASRTSALQCLTSPFREAFEAVPEDIRAMHELELEEHFKPSPNDYLLRKRLWSLVTQPGASGIDQPVLAGDIMTQQNLSHILQKHPHRYMWLLTPFETFEEMYEESFYVLLSKIRKYIATNEVNSRNLNTIMQLFGRLEDRVLGPVIKKIDLRKQTIPAPPGQKNVTPEELDRKIKELEEKSTLIPSSSVMPE